MKVENPTPEDRSHLLGSVSSGTLVAEETLSPEDRCYRVWNRILEQSILAGYDVWPPEEGRPEDPQGWWRLLRRLVKAEKELSQARPGPL